MATNKESTSTKGKAGRPKGSRNKSKQGKLGRTFSSSASDNPSVTPGSDNPPDKVVPNLHRSSQPLPGIPTLKKKEYEQLFALLAQRPGSDDLYNLVDRFQATNVLASYNTIIKTYDLISMFDNDYVRAMIESGISPIDELNKLIVSLTRAITAMNMSFTKLAITGDKREPVVDSSGLANFLCTIDPQRDLPPDMQDEYIRAQRDIKATAGELMDDSVKLQQEHNKMISEIAEPISNYGKAQKRDNVVIDMGSDTIKELN